MKLMSEDDRRDRALRFLSGVTSLLTPEVPKPAAHELAASSLNVLIKAALEIGVALLVIYSTLGLTASAGKSAIDDLLARAMIAVHRLPKGRGGQLAVLEVLPPGKAELAKRGVEPAKPHILRGGFKHAVYGEYLGRWASAQGFRHWWEWTLGVKAFDIVYEQEAKLYGVEVCLSGTVEWTATQAIKAASVEGIHEVVVACERKPFLESVMKEINKIDELGLYRGKIVGKLLAEFLP